jgi:hypothetical protein
VILEGLGRILIREDMGAQKTGMNFQEVWKGIIFRRDFYFLVQNSWSKFGNMKYFDEKLYHVTI